MRLALVIIELRDTAGPWWHLPYILFNSEVKIRKLQNMGDPIIQLLLSSKRNNMVPSAQQVKAYNFIVEDLSHSIKLPFKQSLNHAENIRVTNVVNSGQLLGFDTGWKKRDVWEVGEKIGQVNPIQGLLRYTIRQKQDTYLCKLSFTIMQDKKVVSFYSFDNPFNLFFNVSCRHFLSTFSLNSYLFYYNQFTF